MWFLWARSSTGPGTPRNIISHGWWRYIYLIWRSVHCRCLGYFTFVVSDVLLYIYFFRNDNFQTVNHITRVSWPIPWRVNWRFQQTDHRLTDTFHMTLCRDYFRAAESPATLFSWLTSPGSSPTNHCCNISMHMHCNYKRPSFRTLSNLTAKLYHIIRPYSFIVLQLKRRVVLCMRFDCTHTLAHLILHLL